MPARETTPVRLALVGFGAVGRVHAEAIAAHPDAELCALADPVAAHPPAGARRYPTLAAIIGAEAPDGVVIATPNQSHVPLALEAVRAGIAVLVEKPVAVTLTEGRALVEAAERAGVPVAVGHQRRHGGALKAADRLIASGALGDIRAVQVTTWLKKPDEYFTTAWRRSAGAGPVLVNLIHDLDALRMLIGEIASVMAIASPSRRGHPVEDGAAVLLEFVNGVLGTMQLSDATAGPFSWELTAGENPMYPHAGGSALWIAGTEAALTLPDLTLHTHAGAPSWTSAVGAERVPFDRVDPIAAQMDEFVAVVRREREPTVDATSGLQSLAVLAAVQRALASGRRERVERIADAP